MALRLAGGAGALWGLLALLGMFVTHVLVHGRVQSMDRGVDVWFAADRTGAWTNVTVFGSDLAQTQTAIAVTVVVVLFLRWRLGGGMSPGSWSRPWSGSCWCSML